MAGDPQHIHDPATAEEFARDLGLQVGGAGHPFVGNWGTKGLYAYRSGQYKGMAYFGTGGSERDRLTMPHESEKYRPWNRYDPNIPDHIRKRLIELEDDDSTSIAQPSWPARAQPSVEPSSDDMLGGENILVSGHSIPKYNGIYAIQTNEINGKPWYKNNSGCILYFYNANSGGGPSWSLDDRSQDGTNDWFRGGWIEPPNSGGPPLGTRRWAIFETHRRFEIKLESVSIPDEDSRRRNDGGRIALKSVHGKYLSAQPDGRAEWNRTVASDWEFFELGERDGRKITLRSTHGKYVSAQPDGAVQINRDHAPPGGWEEFTVETRPGSTPGDAHDFLHLKSVHGFYLSAQADGTAQWNRDHAPPGGWEDIQFVPYSTQNQEPAPIKREESIEILEAVAGRPVRFKINNRPSSNDAWVGIYPPNARHQDHGAENNRWKWLRNIDVNNAAFRRQSSGPQSIRVFADGGYTLHARKDFNVSRADPADSSSSKRRAVAAMGIGIILFTMGLPLLIMGSISTAEDRLAMLIPGAVLTSFGAFILFMSVAVVIRMGSVEKHSSVAGTGAADSDSTSLDVLLRASSKEEVWMKEAEFDGQRLNGLIPDHRNNFTKKVTTSKIVAQDKVGNLTRFETGLTTYLVYDRDLQIQQNDENPFWDID